MSCHPLHFGLNELENDITALQQQLAATQGYLTNHAPVSLGGTPRICIGKIGGASVYHYAAPPKQTNADHRPPILILFALLNRLEILDLSPSKTLIGDLIRSGHPVYAVDWGTPTPETTLQDYIFNIIPAAHQQVLQHSNKRQLALMGVCQGGVFALLHAAQSSTSISHLISLVAPYDFATPNDPIAPWIRTLDLAALAKQSPLIPGQWLNQWMRQLKPITLTHTKYLSLLDRPTPEKLDTFLRLELWLNDAPPLATQAFCEFAELFYIHNNLNNKNVTLGTRQITINNINIPTLNIFAQQDHIVPNVASRALKKFIAKGNYQEQSIAAGHIGLFVNDQARNDLVETIQGWMDTAPRRPPAKRVKRS